MILVTGSRGFVGKALTRKLADLAKPVTGVVREFEPEGSNDVEYIVGDLSVFADIEEVGDKEYREETEDVTFLENIRKTLNNTDVVIHAAGRVHEKNVESNSILSKYRRDNRDLTLGLARMACECGVKRFVFLSSIGVNGSQNLKPFVEDDDVDPYDAYSLSKFEAEQGLLTIAKEKGMDVVIIRPPMVYGENAPGNFGRLVKWVKMGIPLPLGAVNNQRSFVSLDNLVDFILLCADRSRSPEASNEIFFISDGEDVSTSSLLRIVANVYGVKLRLLPVPVFLVRVAAILFGKGSEAKRLFGSLQVSNSKARNLLGWAPVITMREQLMKMAKHDKENN